MKKLLFLMLVSLCCILYSENINDYTEEIVHTFYIGEADKQLGMLLGEEGWGTSENKPASIMFDKNDFLIIGDQINRRVVIYSNDFSVKNIYNDDTLFSHGNYFNNSISNLLFSSYYSRIFVLNKLRNKSVELNIPINQEHSSSTIAIFTDKVIFSYLKNGSIVSFILEDFKTLRYSSMLDSEKTRELFNEKEKYGLEDYTIDIKNRIFYKGEIYNKDYKILYTYWKELHRLNNERQPRIVSGIPSFDKLENAEFTFFGNDEDQNSYFYIASSCVIFDKNGWPLEGFLLDNNPLTVPTVNANGDVFYLSLGEKDGEVVFNLHKIARQW